MADLPQTPKGKIARLPARLREAVCRRLHDGETAGQILPWLNAEPEAIKMLSLHFDGEGISAQNLSAWRQGGFQKWLADKEEIEGTKSLAAFALQVAKAAGMSMIDGTAAIAAGRVMQELREQYPARDSEDDGGGINPKLLDGIAKLQAAGIMRKKLDLDVRKTDQKDRQLDLAEKVFQTRFAEMFLKFFDEEETRRIATSGDRKETKVKELVKHWFGEMPEGIGPPSLNAA